MQIGKAAHPKKGVEVNSRFTSLVVRSHSSAQNCLYDKVQPRRKG
jgi:hypothetical protein